ncbi:MAG: hypothetical protein SVR94_09120 [Pseudomonadota bacterium]|nr:hypothetical protein [Pseudomonadota bacterium]
MKTKEINKSVKRIENFLGIESETLSPVYGNKGKQKFNILSKIDKNFLEEKANLHCGELMNQYFPEIKGFESKS